jgi:hypothetical protein
VLVASAIAGAEGAAARREPEHAVKKTRHHTETLLLVLIFPSGFPSSHFAVEDMLSRAIGHNP